jgi:hypothetical protein
MIRCRLALAADRFLLDPQANTVSAISIFELVQAIAFPMAIGRLSLLFVLQRSDDDPLTLAAHVSLNLPPHDLMGRLPISINFQGRKQNRVLFTIEGVIIPAAGTLTITLTRDDTGEDLGSFQVDILSVQLTPAPS